MSTGIVRVHAYRFALNEIVKSLLKNKNYIEYVEIQHCALPITFKCSDTFNG